MVEARPRFFGVVFPLFAKSGRSFVYPKGKKIVLVKLFPSIFTDSL